jgi:hypothetical protein
MKKLHSADTRTKLISLLSHQQTIKMKPLYDRLENRLDGIADALYSIAESLDFMAATSENPDVCTKPTERETAIIFEALKNDFIGQMTTLPTEVEHLAAMRRIRALSKGGMHE